MHASFLMSCTKKKNAVKLIVVAENISISQFVLKKKNENNYYTVNNQTFVFYA